MEALEASERIYRILTAAAGEPAPAMRAWDGTTWGDRNAAATLVLRHPGSLRSAFLPPNDLSAGEAYIFDDFDIEGDILSVVDFGERILGLKKNPSQAVRLLRLLRSLPKENRRSTMERPKVKGRLHSKRRDSEAVRSHYDTGNDFFEHVLDPQMVYSCAYFLDPDESLEVAQRRKLDVVCRKLELTEGKRFLDVGCGWGALVIHAAKNFGVEATGITLSPEQAAYAEKRVKELGLEDRVMIRVMDYRDLGGTFDGIASVGMVEHVGEQMLDTYFTSLLSSLAPGGLLLNHGITTTERNRGRIKPTFVSTYVFPDGVLVPIEKIIESAEGVGLEARDVESLRINYAITLRHWVANLEANADGARQASNETTYRIWRMYMAGSAVAFERNAVSVYQTLLARPSTFWRHGRKQLLASDDK